MAESFLGMGHRKSIREVVTLAEEQVGKVEGNTRRLLMRSSGIEVVADRPDYTSPFLAYIVRIAASGKAAAELRTSAEACHDLSDCAIDNE